MSTYNILAIVVCTIMLTGCASTLTVKTDPIERVSLDIVLPDPLILRNVEWSVNGSAQFILDAENFENLSKNAEDVQNRLFLQHTIISKQKEFYD